MRDLIITLLLFSCASIAHAWGVEGHRIVAEIATRHLTPRAAARVVELLRDDLTADGEPSGRHALAEVGSWADEFRATAAGRKTAPWHYENNPVCGTASRAEVCPGGNCASVQLERFIAVLRNPAESYRDRNEALKWVTHLVADIHQPLHAADNHDRGGNNVPVSFFGETSWQFGTLNLHAIWDEHLLQQILRADGGEVAFVSTPVPDGERIAWQAGTVSSWMAESHEIVRNVVYGKLPTSFACDRPIAGPVQIDQDYFSAVAPTIRTQLRKAGVRLAKALNDAL